MSTTYIMYTTLAAEWFQVIFNSLASVIWRVAHHAMPQYESSLQKMFSLSHCYTYFLTTKTS